MKPGAHQVRPFSPDRLERELPECLHFQETTLRSWRKWIWVVDLHLKNRGRILRSSILIEPSDPRSPPALRGGIQYSHPRHHLLDMQNLGPDPLNSNLLSAGFLRDLHVDKYRSQLSVSGSHLGCFLESPGA